MYLFYCWLCPSPKIWHIPTIHVVQWIIKAVFHSYLSHLSALINAYAFHSNKILFCSMSCLSDLFYESHKIHMKHKQTSNRIWSLLCKEMKCDRCIGCLRIALICTWCPHKVWLSFMSPFIRVQVFWLPSNI